MLIVIRFFERIIMWGDKSIDLFFSVCIYVCCGEAELWLEYIYFKLSSYSMSWILKKLHTHREALGAEGKNAIIKQINLESNTFPAI